MASKIKKDLYRGYVGYFQAACDLTCSLVARFLQYKNKAVGAAENDGADPIYKRSSLGNWHTPARGLERPKRKHKNSHFPPLI